MKITGNLSASASEDRIPQEKLFEMAKKAIGKEVQTEYKEKIGEVVDVIQELDGSVSVVCELNKIQFHLFGEILQFSELKGGGRLVDELEVGGVSAMITREDS